MVWWHAGIWGLVGGAAAVLASLTTAVAKADFDWPWRDGGSIGPWVFVFLGELTLGGMVAAAMHSSISGAWPAFTLGATGLTTVRHLLSKVEVRERPEVDRPRVPIESIIQDRGRPRRTSAEGRGRESGR